MGTVMDKTQGNNRVIIWLLDLLVLILQDESMSKSDFSMMTIFPELPVNGSRYTL
jgi:hypothetical protein